MRFDIFEVTGSVVMVAVVGFVGYVAVESIRSNGETDYCYVEMWSPPQMSPQWMLKAHRPWREDRQIGIYPTLDEAQTKAATMGCKLNSK